MTFRARLVLATTAAVVVAVLAASLASFLVARHTLLQATDNSLTTAAQRIVAGQEFGSTTATLGQVTDSTGRRRLRGRPARDRPGAARGEGPRPGVLHDGHGRRQPDPRTGRAPARRHRVRVRHPPRRWRAADRHPAERQLGAQDARHPAGRRGVDRRPPRRRPGLAGGPHRTGPAQLADRHRRGPGRDDRRLAPALSPEAPTSWAACAAPSTACSRRWSPRAGPRASWFSTPRTSCARRSPACAPTSR